MLPSSGYFYVGEPVRGACVLGSEVAAMGLMAIGGNESFNNGVFIHPMVSVGAISFAIIWIWSIFDVVKVAKIKNLANQNNKVTIKLNSDLNFISQDYTNNSAVYGLKLSIGFWKKIEWLPTREGCGKLMYKCWLIFELLTHNKT